MSNSSKDIFFNFFLPPIGRTGSKELSMEIHQIKQSLSIEVVLSHYGLGADRWHRLSCPWHNDKTPSLQIYPKTNTWTCFSTNCSAGSGDQIDFIQKHENCSTYQAILKAKSMITQQRPIVKAKTENDLPKNESCQLLSEAFSYFQKGLKHSGARAAKAYCQKRGLNGKLEIGYNAGSWHQGKPEAVLKNCMAVGLLKPSYKGYGLWAKGCIIFPLRNEAKEIVGLYGRSTYEDATNRHFYLQGQRGLYPAYPGVETTHLILCESVIDAASLLQLELPKGWSVLALYGTENLKTAHRQAILKCLRLEEIIFAFDGDGAGKKATQKYCKSLSELYPKLRFSTLNLPDGEDINSLYANHLEEAQSLFEELFENRKAMELAQSSSAPIESDKSNDFSDERKKPVRLGGMAVASKVKLQDGELNTTNTELLKYRTEELEGWLLGGIRMTGLDRLKMTLKLIELTSGKDKSLRHNFDLYNDDQVEKMVKKAAGRLEVSSKIVRSFLEKLTEALESWRLEQIEGKQSQNDKAKLLTPKELEAATNYLSTPKLMERTSIDIGKSGVIGEELNRLIMYLIFTSRKMPKPLHVISFGSSGSGKTHLQSAIAALIPEEAKIETTALSDNAVYYFGENELGHKLVLVEDLDGAEGVMYALRELKSKQEVKKTVTIKDEKGKLKTVTLLVRGPISFAACTTRERLYEDNANRSFLLYIDESRKQDELIMEEQRKMSSGKINESEQISIREQFQDMQQLLQPIKVINPYADYIRIPEKAFKPRRTNGHILAFIEAITFYHQYQRAKKRHPETGETYIESTIEDIEWAFKLLQPILLRKSDELSGRCRDFFERLKKQLKASKAQTFYQKPVRESMRLNPNNLKHYLRQLQQYGYIKIVGGSRYRGFEYEVTNMAEYGNLQKEIQECFSRILQTIRKKSG